MFNRFKREIILPVKTNVEKDGGIQRIYQFEGTMWGASVIMRYETSDGGKEGLWEIAPQWGGHLLHWDHAYEIGLYDTKGHLNDAQLQDELHKIKRYAERGFFMRVQEAMKALFTR
tara:strand:- start:181 stop:528 length:348 start_codon:yes stop_codon:yes gene_type:complete